LSGRKVSNAADDAVAVIDAFIQAHHAAAIPALIGAAVMWAVDNGGADVVKGSLRNAIKLADAMSAARKAGAA